MLGWGEVPDPCAVPGEVIVDVAATAVNRADLMQRQGFYPPPKGASDIIGLECSGGRREVGEGVTGWSVGDEVCALLAGGGYAERVAVPVGQLLPGARRRGLADGAALPEADLHGLVERVPARRACARASASSSTAAPAASARWPSSWPHAPAPASPSPRARAAKLAACRELGADVAINYRDEDFVERIKDETDGAVPTSILDTWARSTWPATSTPLAVDGRLVVIGMQGGTKAELDLGTLLAKRAPVHRDDAARPPAGRRRRPRSSPPSATTSGRRRAPASSARSSTAAADVRAAEAHRLVEASEHIGKVLLLPED